MPFESLDCKLIEGRPLKIKLKMAEEGYFEESDLTDLKCRLEELAVIRSTQEEQQLKNALVVTITNLSKLI
jgi:hypothetical protein